MIRRLVDDQGHGYIYRFGAMRGENTDSALVTSDVLAHFISLFLPLVIC